MVALQLVAVGLAFRPLVLPSGGQEALAPVTVPYEVTDTAIAIKAKVDGQERTLALSTSSPAAYERGEGVRTASVEVGGRSLGRVDFKGTDDATVRVLGGDGALGSDALARTAVGVDAFGRTLDLWPRGGLDPRAADAWVAKAPAWDGPAKVRRLPLVGLPEGGLAVEARIGGAKVPLLLRLGFSASLLEPLSGLPKIPLGSEDAALLPSFDLNGLPTGPVVYLPRPKGAVSVVGASGSLTLDALASRRILVDFAARAVYVEDLSEDARLSLFLLRTLGAPLRVEGDRVALSPIPGYEGSQELAPDFGSEVLRFAGVPTSNWLGVLRGRDEAAWKDMADRLSAMRQEGFGVRLRKPDGTEVSINLRR